MLAQGYIMLNYWQQEGVLALKWGYNGKIYSTTRHARTDNTTLLYATELPASALLRFCIFYSLLLR